MAKPRAKRTQQKKCLQTICGMTCIKTGYKCKDKDLKSKENVKAKTKNLVRQLGDKAWVAQGRAKNKAKSAIGAVRDKAWVAQGIFKNKTKALVNKVKQNFNLLKDRTWVNSSIVRRKLSEGLKRSATSLISKVKSLASLPNRATKVLKQEGIAGIKNRAWLARSQVKAKVKNAASRLSNKTWLAAAQTKAGINKVTSGVKNKVNSKVLQPAKKSFNDLANNVWYSQNRRRYQFN